MTLNHVHCSVCDLRAAIQWLREVWLAEPTFANDRMAVVPFGALTVIFDQSDKDTCATIGFESADCDADYNTVVERGAVPLEPPSNRAWGARSAYLRGPGAITFEIEQVLT
jgi:uncharacterized glyoxalase superfamily protein PhnB